MNNESKKRMKHELADAFWLANYFKLNEGIDNHFSATNPENKTQFYINPYYHWSTINPCDLVCVSTNSQHQDHPEIESTAFNLHQRLHKSIRHANCFMHTHQPYATALSNCKINEIIPLLQTSLRLYKGVAFDDGFSGFFDRDETINKIVSLARENDVVILRNHGVLVSGRTIAEAFDQLYYLERIAQSIVLTLSTGLEINLITKDHAEKAYDDFKEQRLVYADIHFQSLRKMKEKLNT